MSSASLDDHFQRFFSQVSAFVFGFARTLRALLWGDSIRNDADADLAESKALSPESFFGIAVVGCYLTYAALPRLLTAQLPNMESLVLGLPTLAEWVKGFLAKSVPLMALGYIGMKTSLRLAAGWLGLIPGMPSRMIYAAASAVLLFPFLYFCHNGILLSAARTTYTLIWTREFDDGGMALASNLAFSHMQVSTAIVSIPIIWWFVAPAAPRQLKFTHKAVTVLIPLAAATLVWKGVYEHSRLLRSDRSGLLAIYCPGPVLATQSPVAEVPLKPPTLNLLVAPPVTPGSPVHILPDASISFIYSTSTWDPLEFVTHVPHNYDSRAEFACRVTVQDHARTDVPLRIQPGHYTPIALELQESDDDSSAWHTGTRPKPTRDWESFLQSIWPLDFEAGTRSAEPTVIVNARITFRTLAQNSDGLVVESTASGFVTIEFRRPEAIDDRP